MIDILKNIKKNVISGHINKEDEGFEGDMVGKPGVVELVEQAVKEKINPADILNKAINPGMEEVGSKYENGEYLIPDMLAAAECVGEAMKIIEPLLVHEHIAHQKKFVIATVEGDLHDIGKNIVASMLKGTGFKVNDLGTGVSADKIIDEVKQSKAKYLGLSALLTTTMVNMKEVIELLEKEGLRGKVTVLVGGAPVSEEFAQTIGADFYCEDAFDALNKLKTV